jgi:hypothetical protein
MTGKSSKRDERAERLAEALRANLRKRKSQARQRRSACPDSAPAERDDE